ncbi:hypothetical protein Ctob_008816 [Chrysochromulina tobinii]|uniref:Uncharacterized protein n=1 Tax=Chrysochromulina tobinii TaxID=1460289 RepID=A0A0M0JS97_9EUKA|nr:hypothetical protein Ctob_008816 [Chrysochromulina tobinii]|eukprot:KOO29476.1 hypothetical protein Ctob_008816 [Chrysochromulina sp. CCMP291]
MQAHVSVAIDASGSTDNAPVPAFELTSNEGVPLAALPHLTALGERCQVYMRRALAEQADPRAHLSLYPDPLQGWARVFERRLLADEWYLPTVLMHSPFRRTAIDLPLRYEMWPENEAGARARYWASLPEAEWGGAMLLDGKALAAAQRSPALFAKKVLPSHEPTLLRRHDAWMARKLSGEPEPQQPPIASPHLRADPTLDSFGMPALGGEAAADDGDAPSRAPDPDVPPDRG